MVKGIALILIVTGAFLAITRAHDESAKVHAQQVTGCYRGNALRADASALTTALQSVLQDGSDYGATPSQQAKFTRWLFNLNGVLDDPANAAALKQVDCGSL